MSTSEHTVLEDESASEVGNCHSHQRYTLADLIDERCPLREFCDTKEIRSLPAEQWANCDDTRRDYVFLLNQLLGAHLRRCGLAYGMGKIQLSVRLCVSPSVSASYNVTSSKEFGISYADCKADDRTVSEKDIHYKPHDVGVAAGAVVAGQVYSSAVKLDSSDIFDGDIGEAITRLVMVPIPTSALMEYDLGYEEGRVRFQKIVDKVNQKDSEHPH